MFCDLQIETIKRIELIKHFSRMLDSQTIKICKENSSIRNLKIKNIEYAIHQAEIMIKESKMSPEELSFLRKKISESRQDLGILYLMKI